MNLKSYLITTSACMTLALFSCNEPKQEVKEYKYEKPKEVAEIPIKMIKSPDGNLYFPENYHRPKSDRDSVVMVYPSDLK